MVSIPKEELLDCIQSAKKIMLTTHFGPDGDAVGSILAAQHFFTALGKQCVSVVPNKFPKFLDFVPGSKDILIYEGNEAAIQKISNESDLVIILDYNTLGRIGDLKNVIDTTKQKVILIDHHQQPDDFTINISDTNASSTCEIFYRIIDCLAPEYLNSEIATCLYTGLVTDTGSFKHNSTTAYTHMVAAKLIEAGANASEIQESISNSGSYRKLQLLGFALYEKMKLVADGKVAYITLSKAEMDKFEYENGDTDGLVNYGLSIQGVIMAVLIKESDTYIKMSFRCVGDFSVNDFARKYFNGGGHTRAAGGRFDESLEQCEAKFLNAIENEKHLLH